MIFRPETHTQRPTPADKPHLSPTMMVAVAATLITLPGTLLYFLLGLVMLKWKWEILPPALTAVLLASLFAGLILMGLTGVIASSAEMIRTRRRGGLPGLCIRLNLGVLLLFALARVFL
ncbi:hypothetical protein [Planctomicrobium sp. SH664]|uniref:hypothetical protein n=1 Tax=Planctomicrobium sp. SH664 TaxID=3448125 RepID=UPI003F5BEEDD